MASPRQRDCRQLMLRPLRASITRQPIRCFPGVPCSHASRKRPRTNKPRAVAPISAGLPGRPRVPRARSCRSRPAAHRRRLTRPGRYPAARRPGGARNLHSVEPRYSIFVATMDRDDATGEVVIITVFETRLLHHLTQRLLVGMHPDGLGQVAIAGLVIGYEPAQLREDAE